MPLVQRNVFLITDASQIHLPSGVKNSLALLRQLVAFASFSRQFFEDINKDLKLLDQRVSSLHDRGIRIIKARNIRYERTTNFDRPFRDEQIASNCLLVESTMPKALQIEYMSKASSPPALGLFDEYLLKSKTVDQEDAVSGISPINYTNSNISCMEKYSDPQLFYREWEKIEETKFLVSIF